MGKRLDAVGLDAMLVTDLVNVRYLSGFTGSNAALLVYAADDSRTRLATDGRYRTQAAQQSPDLRLDIERAGGPHLVGHAAASGVARLGETPSDKLASDGSPVAGNTKSPLFTLRAKTTPS